MILSVVIGLLLAYLSFLVLDRIVDSTIAGLVAVVVFLIIAFSGSGIT